MQEEEKTHIPREEIQEPSNEKENMALLKQIKKEYDISEKYQKDKRKKWNTQMNLMHNIKLNKEKIGDETMWTTFNTVQSSLDSDTLTVSFDPTEM